VLVEIILSDATFCFVYNLADRRGVSTTLSIQWGHGIVDGASGRTLAFSSIAHRRADRDPSVDLRHGYLYSWSSAHRRDPGVWRVGLDGRGGGHESDGTTGALLSVLSVLSVSFVKEIYC
jgi:hypothetical protein